MNTMATPLEMHVRMLSEEFHPRDWQHPKNMDKAASYVEGIFSLYGGDPSFQEFKVYGSIYRNVIARFGPRTGPKLIVGAHYDSCCTTPGADDNASGVAGLLELARLLRENQPKFGVELVAYALEEPPFFGTEWMGSYIHAKNLDPKQIMGAIVFEMIGYFTDEDDTQTFPFPTEGKGYPSRGDFIAVVGNERSHRLVDITELGMRRAGIPALSLVGSEEMDIISLSDHSSYWKFGIPGIMVTDTAFLRNKNYHRPQDTADTLDYERMAMVVNGTMMAIKTIKHRGM